MTGWVVTRRTKSGPRYDARHRDGDGIIRGKTFPKRKDAERYLTAMVGRVQTGTYVAVAPTMMADVFTEYLDTEVALRLTEGTLKPSTAKSYRSMIAQHLMPAFGTLRSDRLTVGGVGAWRKACAEKVAAGEQSGKTVVNLRNLFHAICRWARHPSRRYLVIDPLDGLPALRLPRGQRRPHFEPAQVVELMELASQTPPDDTIIKVAIYSGLRRGEIFGLQWGDLDFDAGRLHVRRSIYQGDVTLPKTPTSTRVVDLPRRLLDDLAIYKVMHPPVGDGFVFRQAAGRPLDPDTWHREHLVPLLVAAGLRLPGSGLHALRHTYVSLLIAQGEDVRYIADQVGHSTTALTRDVYAHAFQARRTAAMAKLDTALDRREVPDPRPI